MGHSNGHRCNLTPGGLHPLALQIPLPLECTTVDALAFTEVQMQVAQITIPVSRHRLRCLQALHEIDANSPIPSHEIGLSFGDAPFVSL